MEVILLERIARVGAMGEVVNVKDGYARNFLLPRGKALRANEANKKRFEAQKADLIKRNEEEKKKADGVSKKIDGKTFVVIRQAGETGQLYGSVTTRDIADAVSASGTTVLRTQVRLDTPIKLIGLHKITLHLHGEVDAQVTINVARTEEEAKRQAKGEDLTKPAEQSEIAAEIAANAAQVFENAEAVEA